MSSTDSVSKWFLEYEISRSAIADRLGINNRPPAWVKENAVELATHVLDPIRTAFGIPFSPQSWYRSEDLEKALTWEKGFRLWCAKYTKPWVGQQHIQRMYELGVHRSWSEYFERKSHPQGKAADIEIPGVDNDKLFFWIRDNMSYDQLIREYPVPSDGRSGWVHVSWAGVQSNRNSSFSIPYYDRYA